MTSTNPTLSTEDVLDQFMMEHEHGRETLERYIRAHPQYAGELIDLSRMISSSAAEDESFLSAADQSRIDAAWIVHAAALPAAPGTGDPFASLTGETGRAMSVKLGVPRQVMTCFRERKINPSSVPSAVLRHFADQFELPMAHVIAAMQPVPGLASGRSFKADGKPGTQGQISFEQVLIDAGVSETDRLRLLTDV